MIFLIRLPDGYDAVSHSPLQPPQGPISHGSAARVNFKLAYPERVALFPCLAAVMINHQHSSLPRHRAGWRAWVPVPSGKQSRLYQPADPLISVKGGMFS